MKLIDADALKEAFSDLLTDGYVATYGAVESRITLAPTIDAIPRAALLSMVEKVIKNGGGVLDVYDTIKHYGGQSHDE